MVARKHISASVSKGGFVCVCVAGVKGGIAVICRFNGNGRRAAPRGGHMGE